MKKSTTETVSVTLTREQLSYLRYLALAVVASNTDADNEENLLSIREAWAADRPAFVAQAAGKADPRERAGAESEIEGVDKALSVAEAIQAAMDDRLVTLPVKMTRAQYARLVGAARLVDASVEDVALANVLHGLDHSASSLSDSLACIRADVVTYAHERKAFAEPGSRHPLQSVDAEMEIGGRRA